MKKTTTMKKFLCMAILVSMLVACTSSKNNSTASSEPKPAISQTTQVSGSNQDSYENQLTGSWYAEPGTARVSGPIFTLYSDGTCEIDGQYGTGTWAVVNDGLLKLTDFYGQVINFFSEDGAMQIVSLEDGCLTLCDRENTFQWKLYNTPQE